jgi:hypothetical protein
MKPEYTRAWTVFCYAVPPYQFNPVPAVVVLIHFTTTTTTKDLGPHGGSSSCSSKILKISILHWDKLMFNI